MTNCIWLLWYIFTKNTIDDIRERERERERERKREKNREMGTDIKEV